MAAPRSSADLALLLLRLSGIGLAVFHGWPKLAALAGGTSRFHEGLAAMGLPLPVALAWAVHPMHASTVLYVVQRMALFGAIAQLAAVLVRTLAHEGASSR